LIFQELVAGLQGILRVSTCKLNELSMAVNFVAKATRKSEIKNDEMAPVFSLTGLSFWKTVLESYMHFCN
jgi:hypothetical protein